MAIIRFTKLLLVGNFQNKLGLFGQKKPSQFFITAFV